MSNNYNLEKKYLDMLNLDIHQEHCDYTTFYTCPVCNDGQSHGLKHRFNWVHNGSESFVNCFNCGYSLPFSLFLKDQDESVYKEFIAELKSNGSYFEYKKDEDEDELVTSPVVISDEFKEAKTSKQIVAYLKSRKLEKHIDKFFVNDFNELVIPLRNRNNKIYAYQTRNIKEKDFKIFLSKSNRKFKAWNFYNVDLEKPVYIFEGIEDCLSIGQENVIATLGKTIPEFLLKQIKYPIFCYDNDADGFVAMLKASSKSFEYKNHPTIVYYTENFKHKDTNEYLKQGLSEKEVFDLLNERLMSGIKLKVLAESFKIHKKKKRNESIKKVIVETGNRIRTI